MRSYSLLPFAAAAALALAACSGTNTKSCTPSNCAGCCDSTGSCQGGSASVACGTAGAACTECSLGQTCTFGQCGSSGLGGGSGGGGSGGSGGGSTGGGSGGGDGGTTGGGGGSVDAGVDAGVVNPCAGTLQLCTDRCLDLQADPENCGRCGQACGQGRVCSRGQCAVLPDDCTVLTQGCGAGYFCDPVSKKCMTGCRLTTDCPTGAACTGGSCGCPTTQHACGQACVADDVPASCGSRCSTCAQPAHSVATCSASTCGFTCDSGYAFNSGLCVDVDECATNNGGCSANAACTNTQGGRTCACAAGFTGDGVACTDVNECATNNGACDLNATCTNTPGSRTCTCNGGYTGNGQTCADVDECVTNNGGCASGATCTNTPGSRTCACGAGYTGNGLTCTDVNECLTNNGGCTTNASCTNTPGARTCACNTGFTGDGLTCADVNECLTNNGGCATVATGGVCTNTVGSRTCTCATGFTGSGLSCADINECLTSNGGCATVATGGVCTNTPGSRTCACATGYSGTGLTCTDVNECLTNNGGCAAVASGGVCTNTAGARTCACATGFTGDGLTCTDIDECLTSNGGCSVNGTCTNTPGSRTCACNSGYAGNGITCTPGGETCTTPVTLTAGVTFNGSTVGAANDYFTALSQLCDGLALAGPDVVHQFTPPATGTYRVGVTASYGARVWLSTSCGATASCQASLPEFSGATGFTFRGTAATPVFIVVDGQLATSAGAYALTVTAVAPVASETCATATPLALGTPLSGTFTNSINDVTPQASCGSPYYTQPELVYAFTPSITGPYAYRETTASDVVLWVSTTCDGTCFAYVDDPENLLLNLTAGTPYFFFVEPYTTATTFTLTLDPVVVPANDTCANPTVLTASTSVGGTTLGAANDYAGPLSAACWGLAMPAADVVYSFTPPATGNYLVTTANSAGVTDAWVSSTCGDGASCAAVESTASTNNVVFRGTAGVPAFITVDGTGTGTSDFSISVVPVAAPANDTCATAEVLTLGTPTNGSTAGAFDDVNPLPACGPSRRSGEVVYTFTPTTTAQYLFRETSASDVVMWASTTCDGACLAFIDEPEELLVTLTAGVPAFFFVEPYSARAPFTVDLTLALPPANDTCSAPQALTLATPVAASTSLAVNDYPGPLSATCGSLSVAGPDAVYSFTPSASGNFAITATGSGWTPTVWTSSSCGVAASCTWAGSSQQVVRGVAATPFFITVDSFGATSSGSFTLDVQSIAAPPNDVCASAIPLTSGVTVNATTVGAVNDVHPLPACSNSTRRNGEVVFSFTPPTSGTWVFHETSPSDVLMWVSPSCDGSCLAYIDDPEDLPVTLTAGTTYYFFVEPWSTPGPISVVVSPM